ncbi:MAG: hypothetical protein OXL34_07720 [Gemmatimonadota bacterium]|nr:hypothetical protein [Gemmatimonadota bacterium]
MPRRRRFIPLLVAAHAACGDDTSTTADIPVQIADSAGVRIVTYQGTPPVKTAFHLAAVPRYRHGADPGGYTFQEVSIGRLLPDGAAVVFDPWINELVVLDRDGANYRVLAGEGEGPGEVGSVDGLFLLSRDSILVADHNLHRLTLFVGGSAVRTTALRLAQGLSVHGVGSSGELLVANHWGPSGHDVDWLPGHMIRLDMETRTLDTVASYDFIPRIPQGLEWNPIAAVGEVTVAAGHYVYTRSDRPEVTWRLPGGTVTQIVRWQADPTLLAEDLLAPIEAERRLLLRQHNSQISDAQLAEVTREQMGVFRAVIGRPMPLFGSPFADSEGAIWLPSYKTGGENISTSPYTVIGPDGEWLGTVETPPRFRILDVAGGLVLGVELDEMDVENVVVYELIEG